MEEFDRLRREADTPIDHEALRTFREDYEVYGAETGEVTASYSGRCSVCDVGLDFTIERGFYTREPT